jgi:hypothetical protein
MEFTDAAEAGLERAGAVTSLRICCWSRTKASIIMIGGVTFSVDQFFDFDLSNPSPYREVPPWPVP